MEGYVKHTCAKSRRATTKARTKEAAQLHLTSLAHPHVSNVSVRTTAIAVAMVRVIETGNAMADTTPDAMEIIGEAVADLKIVHMVLVMNVESAINSVRHNMVVLEETRSVLTVLKSANDMKSETSRRILTQAERNALHLLNVVCLKTSHVSVIKNKHNLRAAQPVTLVHNSVQAMQLQQGATIATAQATWHVTARIRQGAAERNDDILPHLHRDSVKSRDSVRP